MKNMFKNKYLQISFAVLLGALPITSASLRGDVISFSVDGTIRALAHTGRGRLAAFPDLSPMADTLPGYEAYEWNGVFVPAKTPRAIITRLNAGLNDTLRAQAVTDRLASLSVQTRTNTPAEFGDYVKSEIAKWGKIVRGAGIKVE